MIRMLLELILEDGRRFEVGGVSLVGLLLCPGEVECGEDLRLVIIGIALGERFVRLGARGLPILLGTRREVLVVSGDCFDVISLALRLRADAASLVDRRLCRLGAFGRRALTGERI